MTDEREPDQPFSPLSWIRDVRVTPGMLIGILGTLGVVWAIFHYTDLWYVLFP